MAADTETTHPRTQTPTLALDHMVTTITVPEAAVMATRAQTKLPSPAQAAMEAQTTTIITPAEAMAARLTTARVARATRLVAGMEGTRPLAQGELRERRSRRVCRPLRGLRRRRDGKLSVICDEKP